MDYLVAAIEAYKPDMVIIDNVCDLLPNINEAEDCIRLIDQLMQLAADQRVVQTTMDRYGRVVVIPVTS